MKVYVVEMYGGEYSDQWHRIASAFSYREVAQEYIDGRAKEDELVNRAARGWYEEYRAWDANNPPPRPNHELERRVSSMGGRRGGKVSGLSVNELALYTELKEQLRIEDEQYHRDYEAYKDALSSFKDSFFNDLDYLTDQLKDGIKKSYSSGFRDRGYTIHELEVRDSVGEMEQEDDE